MTDTTVPPLDQALDAMIWIDEAGQIHPAKTRDDAKAILAVTLWADPGWNLDTIAEYLQVSPQDLATGYLGHINTTGHSYDF
jgi:hypothetical protein